MTSSQHRVLAFLGLIFCLPGILLFALWMGLPSPRALWKGGSPVEGPGMLESGEGLLSPSTWENAWFALIFPFRLVQEIPQAGYSILTVLLFVGVLLAWVFLKFLHTESALLALLAGIPWYLLALVIGVETAPFWQSPDLYWGYTFAGLEVIPVAILVVVAIFPAAYRAARRLLDSSASEKPT